MKRNYRSSSKLYHAVEGMDPDTLQTQVAELLDGIRYTHIHSNTTQVMLRTIRDLINGLPPQGPITVQEAKRALWEDFRIAIPFPEPQPSHDAHHKLVYSKPVRIDVIESAVLGAVVKEEQFPVIDLVITMPKSVFQDKDYLNYRYFHKRAFYLACIATGFAGIPSSSYFVQFSYHGNNPLQPMLIISSVKNSCEKDLVASKCEVRILLAAPPDLFPLGKLLPWKNSVRVGVGGGSLFETPLMSTPLYNSSIRSDSTLNNYVTLLTSTITELSAFEDACLLVNIWLRQRGFSSGLHRGGFGSFEASVMMALLLSDRRPEGNAILSVGYTSYQLFKALIHFLAAKDLTKEPLIIGSHNPSAEKVLLSISPMFFDGSYGFNLLFKMTPWSYERLRHESRNTVKLLAEPIVDHFIPSFISKVEDPFLQSDSLFRLTIPAQWHLSTLSFEAGFGDLEICRKLYSTLSAGLGNRVSLIQISQAPSGEWDLASNFPSFFKSISLTISLLVNSEHVGRIVDRGPPVEDKKASKAFRTFWGDKTELRRFKDGSILESLVWNSNLPEIPILYQIVTYVVGRHLHQDIADSLEIFGEDFVQQLPLNQRFVDPSLFLVGQEAFERLQLQIRNLEQLPLQIRQISLSFTELSVTSIDIRGYGGRCSEGLVGIILQFEGSTRWPDNITAIQKTKIAFLLKIGELLEQIDASYRTFLGLENEGELSQNSGFLDILGGLLSFRLRIYHDRELTLLESQLRPLPSSVQSRDLVAVAISAYKRMYIQSPIHTQAIRNLCITFPLLSPVTRLLKHWCASHLLLPHIPEQLLELLAARTFLHPYPFIPPGSLRTGFLRTLAMIAKWDWRTEPLFVNLNGELNKTKAEVMQGRFDAWRNIDPLMKHVTLFVGTNIDQEGIAWTIPGPARVFAGRLTALAQAACAEVQFQGLNLRTKSLFVSPLVDYDFIIYVDRKFCYYGESNGDQTIYENLHVDDRLKEEFKKAGLLALLVKELEKLYGYSILFSHNGGKEAVITGLWNPSTNPRGWKVNLAYSTLPVTTAEHDRDCDVVVSLNKTAILNEIARLGGSMITRIEVTS